MATIDMFKHEAAVIDFKAGQHIFEEGEHGESSMWCKRARWR